MLISLYGLINNYWIMLVSCHEPHGANEPSMLVMSHQSDLSRLGSPSQPGKFCTAHEIQHVLNYMLFLFATIKKKNKVFFYAEKKYHLLTTRFCRYIHQIYQSIIFGACQYYLNHLFCC